jgi:amino acid permease
MGNGKIRLSRVILSIGSLRGSILTLLTTALGVGLLTLPHVLKQNGIALGLWMILLAGLVCIWSMYLLSEVSFKTEVVEYNLLVQKAFGDVQNTFFLMSLIIGMENLLRRPNRRLQLR